MSVFTKPIALLSPSDSLRQTYEEVKYLLEGPPSSPDDYPLRSPIHLPSSPHNDCICDDCNSVEETPKPKYKKAWRAYFDEEPTPSPASDPWWLKSPEVTKSIKKEWISPAASPFKKRPDTPYPFDRDPEWLKNLPPSEPPSPFPSTCPSPPPPTPFRPPPLRLQRLFKKRERALKRHGLLDSSSPTPKGAIGLRTGAGTRSAGLPYPPPTIGTADVLEPPLCRSARVAQKHGSSSLLPPLRK
jgi:hypothetical protein